MLSLPSRERGLKHFVIPQLGNSVSSLPSRERGLKQLSVVLLPLVVLVAPFAGAWIETLLS